MTNIPSHVVDPILVAIIIGSFIYILAEGVNSFQQIPPGEVEWPEFFISYSIGLIFGGTILIAPAYIGDVYFGFMGSIVGLILGYFLWRKLLRNKWWEVE